MPPKQVTCSICNEIVNKSQTLALKNGTRGCRTHPEVQTDADELKQAEQKRRKMDAETPKKRFPWQRDAEPYQEPEHLKAYRERAHTHCWICDTEGVGQREFFTQVVIAMTRLEIRGEFDFLRFPQQIKPLMKGVKPLFMISYDPDVKDKGVPSRIQDRRIRGASSLMRHVLLCNDCISKLGWDDRLKAMIEAAQPTWEQVKAFMPTMALLDPVIRAAAEKQENES